ncbi:MAG: M67 family peptidase [Anaerolineales bacterium]|nr:MAG: M67 family peptidase [Anaerolineales bacterium]
MLEIPAEILRQMHAHGEAAYPEEGAGLLLGKAGDENRLVVDILPLSNSREASARHNRYLIGPLDMLHAEEEADRRGLSVLGVFHSHPDNSSQPSEFDREWALPWFSYVITSVLQGRAVESRSWRLADDRSGFHEESIATLDAPRTSSNRQG